MIDGLGEVDIDTPMPWISTGIEKRDAHDAVWCDSHLRLELVGSILRRIIVDAHGF